MNGSDTGAPTWKTGLRPSGTVTNGSRPKRSLASRASEVVALLILACLASVAVAGAVWVWKAVLG